MGTSCKSLIDRGAAGLSVLAILAGAALATSVAAARYDPDWPCQQIKVPTISLPAVWSGPSIEGLSGKWTDDSEIAELVARLAARRTPLEEAQRLIEAFSDKAGTDKRSRLLLLFAGVFEELNRQRDEVMGGLTRVAHRQAKFADEIRAENHDFLELRAKPDGDQAKLNELNEKITWDLRVYDDRQRSIGYACDVPTVIEQRLFAIGRMIEAKLDSP